MGSKSRLGQHKERLGLEQPRKDVADQRGQGGAGAVDGSRALVNSIFCNAADVEPLLNAVADICHAPVDALAFALCLLFKLVYGFRVRRHFGYLPAEKIRRRASEHAACVWG